MYEIIGAFVIFYIPISLSILATTELNFTIFNFVENYNNWTQFNWFGIVVITLLINILFLPYAILYWTYKLFTVGRR